MRKYNLVTGSKAYFADIVKDCPSDANSFLDLVKFDDAKRLQNSNTTFKSDMLIIRNSDYHGIVEAAHDRLGELIVDLTNEDAEIFIHNPPSRIEREILSKYKDNKIKLIRHEEEYDINREACYNSLEIIKKNIIGQDSAIVEISKSLLYLTQVKRKKPYVIMLYGNSGVGKTELVREIAKHFFEGKCLEKHLSMFMSDRYSEYLFGNEPNRSSLCYELLERESNLLFLDEMDKCPQYLYSLFYTLFDNCVFIDKTYEVNIDGLLIIMTSNFTELNSMKKGLGDPVFYRIDKYIKFNDFSSDAINQIVHKELRDRKEEYQEYCDENELYNIVANRILSSGENARTIKSKIQEEIENIIMKKMGESMIDD